MKYFIFLFFIALSCKQKQRNRDIHVNVLFPTTDTGMMCGPGVNTNWEQTLTMLVYDGERNSFDTVIIEVKKGKQ